MPEQLSVLTFQNVELEVDISLNATVEVYLISDAELESILV